MDELVALLIKTSEDFIYEGRLHELAQAVMYLIAQGNDFKDLVVAPEFNIKNKKNLLSNKKGCLRSLITILSSLTKLCGVEEKLILDSQKALYALFCNLYNHRINETLMIKDLADFNHVEELANVDIREKLLAWCSNVQDQVADYQARYPRHYNAVTLGLHSRQRTRSSAEIQVQEKAHSTFKWGLFFVRKSSSDQSHKVETQHLMVCSEKERRPSFVGDSVVTQHFCENGIFSSPNNEVNAAVVPSIVITEDNAEDDHKSEEKNLTIVRF